MRTNSQILFIIVTACISLQEFEHSWCHFYPAWGKFVLKRGQLNIFVLWTFENILYWGEMKMIGDYI
jgi:hypothetical protein